MSEVSPTRVLRRTLEEALDTDVASTVLFEALGESATGVPRTRDEVLFVVQGPLREVLTRRLDAVQAERLVHRVEHQLSPAEPVTLEMPLEDLASEGRREDATATVPTSAAVPVLVVASGPAFAVKLELALGERRVSPRTASDPASLEDALGDATPALMIVDATSPPTLSDTIVIRAGHTLPTTTACVLFGVELPYGRRLLKSIDAQDRPWVTLERREGVAPLFDLVRSRRRSPVT
ncbi:MAG: hypothetical protein AB8I08_29910 [Sandaracinaceae bacterium]